ncbi:MAG: hypothetical protein GVY13_00575 [Alphaproteobacteria bacterium]|jgi:hypothetical protein|nr:hypothetical protein [Alphaproteobacteria bacterium]
MGSALKWGLVAVGGVLGLVLTILLFALINPFALPFLLLFLVLAVPVFVITVAVVLARRAIRFGVAKIREMTDVAPDERFDSAASYEADMARASGQSDELDQAAARIRRIKKAAHGLADPATGRAMERVADAAGKLLMQAAESRGAARRLRHPLVHQLGHVEAVALNLMRMQEGGVPEPALLHRATATFDGVARDFERHRRSAAAAHALETEARLELLSQELDPSAAGTARAGVGPADRPPPPPLPEDRPASSPREPGSRTPVVDQLFGRRGS